MAHCAIQGFDYNSLIQDTYQQKAIYKDHKEDLTEQERDEIMNANSDHDNEKIGKFGGYIKRRDKFGFYTAAR